MGFVPQKRNDFKIRVKETLFSKSFIEKNKFSGFVPPKRNVFVLQEKKYSFRFLSVNGTHLLKKKIEFGLELKGTFFLKLFINRLQKEQIALKIEFRLERNLSFRIVH